MLKYFDHINQWHLMIQNEILILSEFFKLA